MEEPLKCLAPLLGTHGSALQHRGGEWNAYSLVPHVCLGHKVHVFSRLIGPRGGEIIRPPWRKKQYEATTKNIAPNLALTLSAAAV